MMSRIIISVIMPVYNAERFLSLCIGSVLSQTFTDWELIAVDDGSTDKSCAILSEYANKNDRIHVITKENEGVSVARNIGIRHASADYIYFMDADDILESDALSKLHNAAVEYNATFVKADFKSIDEKGKELFINKKYFLRKDKQRKEMNADDFYNKILLGEFFLWTCLFDRSIITKNKIKFIPHCRMMEDAAFITNYLIHSSCNVFIAEQIYSYRKFGDSVTGKAKDYSSDLMLIFKLLFPLQDVTIINDLLCKIAVRMCVEYGKDNFENQWNLPSCFMPYSFMKCSRRFGTTFFTYYTKFEKIILFIKFKIRYGKCIKK